MEDSKLLKFILTFPVSTTKVRLELVRQYSKLVAEHSNISGRKSYKLSFDNCVKIFPDVIHDTENFLVLNTPLI